MIIQVIPSLTLLFINTDTRSTENIVGIQINEYEWAFSDGYKLIITEKSTSDIIHAEKRSHSMCWIAIYPHRFENLASAMKNPDPYIAECANSLDVAIEIATRLQFARQKSCFQISLRYNVFLYQGKQKIGI